MKPRSLFQSLLKRLRKGKAPVPAKAAAAPAPSANEKEPRRKTESSFEPLEGRIAPAVLLNATTVQFTDVDGDLVTVQFSKSLFKEGPGLPDTLNKVFKFLDGEDVIDFADAENVQFALLDLTALASAGVPNPANGTHLTITAEPQGGQGDGKVNVGYIKAAHNTSVGISLGKVVVDGDLGRIDAGHRKASLGVKSITVDSWGALGTSTQLAGGKLESNVAAGIGTITVAGDFQDALLRVVHGESSARNAGKIGKITIGGDLLASAGTSLTNTGVIAASGNIGSIQVDNILGGTGQGSGKITTTGSIGSVTLAGDLRGGAGKDSGQIVGTGGIGKVSLDTLWAGSGEASGRISSNGNIATVTIGEIAGHHTATGGAAGKNAASISAGGKLGSISVAGNISGGTGEASGRVAAGVSIGKTSIGGHLIGGDGSSSGQILAGQSIGTVTINGAAKDYDGFEAVAGAEGAQEMHVLRFGDVLGRPSDFTISYLLPGSAAQTTTALSSASTISEIQAALNALPGIGADGVTVAVINGNLQITFTEEGQQAGLFSAAVSQAGIVGGTGSGAGSVFSNGSIGKVTITSESGATAALKAGNGAQSGSIVSAGNIGRIVIAGNLDGTGGAEVSAAGGITAGGNVGSLAITGDLMGGAGELTGGVSSQGSIGAIKISGSLHGGAGESSGSIVAAGKVSSAFVTGSLVGGTGGNSASLVAGTDITAPGDFGKVTVLGRLIGDGIDSASIRSGAKLGKVTVGTIGAPGNVMTGGDGSSSASIVGRTGIASVKVNGGIEGGDGLNSATIQSFAKIASVKIAGHRTGGGGEGSGSIAANDLDLVFSFQPGDLGKIAVAGNVTGGLGAASGQIRAEGSIQSVKIGGLSGGEGSASGSIVAGTGLAAFLDEFVKIGGIGSVVVNGSVSGGIGVDSGRIEAGAKINSLVVNGSASESILRTGRDFGSINIAGDVSETLISAQGSAKASARADVAIARLTISGAIADSTILAGYDIFGNAVNGNAQIGAVKVAKTWTATSIAAGVVDVDGDGFGDEDDAVIAGGTISKIASVIIGQALTGTDAGGDQFGIVAQTVGSVKINGVAQALTSAKNIIPLAGSPVTNDTSIREVP